MAYSEELATRVRNALARRRGVVEKKMFGGLAFMVRGHMCVGVMGDELMVRVGPDAYEEALAEPHTREMDFTGRPIKGMIYVGKRGFESSEALKQWVGRGLAFVKTLPEK